MEPLLARFLRPAFILLLFFAISWPVLATAAANHSDSNDSPLKAVNEAEMEAYRMRKQGQNPREKLRQAYQNAQSELGRQQKEAIKNGPALTQKQKDGLQKVAEEKQKHAGEPEAQASSIKIAPTSKPRKTGKAPTTNMEAGAEGGASEVHFGK